MMNRHGLIAGATGTGKTKTLQGLAEQLSAAGVPVFVADVKGDVSGPGRARRRRRRRPRSATAELGMPFAPTGFPVEFLSLGGIGPGVPVRATVSDFGPQLLAKVLGANETQEQSLALVFHYADEKGLPLLDLSDLRALLTFLDSDEGKAELEGIGGLSSATVGVLLRALVGARGRRRQRALRRAAARHRRPAAHRAATAAASISCLELPAVQDKPALFSTALMWLLAELFETLPEAGDLPQAEARLLLRRGAPAVRRRDQGVPRLGRADRAADPLQGRRRLLRHPDAEGRPGRRARRSSATASSTRCARSRPTTRRRCKATVSTFPKSDVLRPRGAAAGAGHRRGGGDDPRENGVPTPVVHTRLRAAALAHGAGRRRRRRARRRRRCAPSTARAIDARERARDARRAPRAAAAAAQAARPRQPRRSPKPEHQGGRPRRGRRRRRRRSATS